MSSLRCFYDDINFCFLCSNCIVIIAALLLSMSSLREDSVNKHVIGYPSAYPPPQSSSNAANGQTTNQDNTCIGYPYPAPLPSPPYALRSADANRNCRRVILFLIFGLLILTIVSFIVCLFIRPQLPEFRIDSAAISSLNSSATGLPPRWEISFWVKNHNKRMRIMFDETEAGLFYGDEKLCETNFPAFNQEKDSEMIFVTKFNQMEGTVATVIQEIEKRRIISVDVEMLVWIWYKSDIFRTWARLISISCADVRIRFNDSAGVGNWAGGEERCQVGYT